MPTGKEIIDAIIKADCVRADEDEPSVLIWDACAEEQIEAALADILKGRCVEDGTPRDSQTLGICQCTGTFSGDCPLHAHTVRRLS